MAISRRKIKSNAHFALCDYKDDDIGLYDLYTDDVKVASNLAWRYEIKHTDLQKWLSKNNLVLITDEQAFKLTK